MLVLDKRQSEFTKVMRVARQLLGDRPFRKRANPQRLSITMWDAGYSAIAELLLRVKEVDFTRAKDHISKEMNNSLDHGFFSQDDEKTSAFKFVARKEEYKRILQTGIQEKSSPKASQRRTFPTDKKWDLFDDQKGTFLFDDQKGTCGICGQSIDKSRLEEPNCVHIDHIQPFSKGGETNMPYAQLTHRECNLSKGAKETGAG